MSATRNRDAEDQDGRVRKPTALLLLQAGWKDNPSESFRASFSIVALSLIITGRDFQLAHINQRPAPLACGPVWGTGLFRI
jgi:hypothetical protein